MKSQRSRESPRATMSRGTIHSQPKAVSALRLKSLVVFPTSEPAISDCSADKIKNHSQARSQQRVSIGTLFPSLSSSPPGYSIALPSSDHVLASSARSTLSTDTTARSLHAPDVIASLRSKTLLDYSFMREFSLGRKKPVSERNLSQMSANSVYNMRAAQIELESQKQKLQPSSNSAESTACTIGSVAHTGAANSKALHPTNTDEIRPALHTSATPTRVTAPSPRHRRILVEHSATVKGDKVLCLSRNITSLNFDITEDSGTSSRCSRTISAHDSTTFYRSTGGQIQLPNVSQHQIKAANQSSKMPKTPIASIYRHRQLRSTSESSPTENVASGHRIIGGSMPHSKVDDSNAGHSVEIITRQHGFLQEQNIIQLMDETRYTRSELYTIWTRFKALCSVSNNPKGVDKATFRSGIQQLSGEDELFVDRLFHILDTDGSRVLEWQEFIDALSALENGDVRKRARVLFRVYDLNGDSAMQRHEVAQVFLSSLLVSITDDLKTIAKHFTDTFFEAVGCRDSDTVKVDDAIAYMDQNPSADIFGLFGRTMVKRVMLIE